MDKNAKVQEIIDFATKNGIQIHGRISPQEWADVLETNNGQCPCKHAPSCPCEDALIRIKDPNRPPEDQVCGCTFFVSEAYLKHYGRKAWVPPISATPQKDIQYAYVKDKTVDPDIEYKATKKVKTYLDGLQMIELGQFDRLDELLKNEQKASKDRFSTDKCDLCAADADIIRANAQFVQAVCHHGDPACEEELSHLINRTKAVIEENFIVAGYKKVPVNIPDTADDSVPEKAATKTNEWVEFYKNIASNPKLENTPQKYRMKIAAALYRGTQPDIDTAMAAIPLQ